MVACRRDELQPARSGEKGSMDMIKRRDFIQGGALVAAGTAIGVVSGPAQAHEYEIGQLKVEHPWLRAPNDGDDKAQFYAFIYNNGSTADRLIGVKSAKVGKTEIHGDVKNLTLVTPVELPPNTKVTLAPGAGYVALLDIKKHLEVSWGLVMTLVFEKAGEVEVEAAIEAPDATHAHDAEAQERWQKAHGPDVAEPKESGGHDHHEHHHDEKSEDAK